jgi:hypothetical protein
MSRILALLALLLPATAHALTGPELVERLTSPFGLTITRTGEIVIVRAEWPPVCAAVDLRNGDLMTEGQRYTLGQMIALKPSLTAEERALCGFTPPVLRVAPNAGGTRPLMSEDGAGLGRVAVGTPCESDPVPVSWAATPRYWTENADGVRGLAVCR